jgi:hypothetical protein
MSRPAIDQSLKSQPLNSRPLNSQPVGIMSGYA